MIGSLFISTALLLPSMVMALPGDFSKLSSSFTTLKKDGLIKDGKLELPVAQYCQGNLKTRFISTNQACSLMTKLAHVVHIAESKLYCSHLGCGAKYDPAAALCTCNLPAAYKLDEDRMWPGKNCKETTICYAPFDAHWNPATNSCTCAVDTIPALRSFNLRVAPNALKDLFYGPTEYNGSAPTIDDHRVIMNNEIKRIRNETQQLFSAWKKQHNANRQYIEHMITRLDQLRLKDEHFKVVEDQLKATVAAVKARYLEERDAHMVQPTTSSIVSFAPLPTYIPPPNTEVTQQLIQESLLLQPQQVATVGSVIPRFADGVITFLVQLDGPICQTLVLNASDTLPCRAIGTHPSPSLILVPKTVKNGTSETTLATCLVIAVNMYSPDFITYWVQKEDGSVFSLLSDNKIRAIDQLDTSQPASIAIQVTPASHNTKRDVESDVSLVTLKRRQIFSVACGTACPFQHMSHVNGNDGYCGCIFKSANEILEIAARGVEQPSPYTVTMTAEACAAMSCINNGGKSALFNPFTATCWCATPTFVETNENAYDGGL